MAIALPWARPDLTPYRPLFQRPRSAGTGPRVVFAGTSTLLFDDGRTALLTDGFFTRPGVWRVGLGRIGSDPVVVDACLGRLGVTRLAAVVCVHAHYDHALDAPLVADRTGALLVGSASTMNLGRGHGLPEDRLHPVVGGEELAFGEFRVRVLASLHSPDDRFPGTIDAPLTPPARASAWRSDTSFSLLISHGGRTTLVQASANHLPGALAGHHADTVYLGIGALGRQSAAFRERYWAEVVRGTGARRVVPIHWDDFFRPLDRPLRAMAYLLDDMDAAMRFVIDRCRGDGVELVLPVPWEPMHPFAAPR